MGRNTYGKLKGYVKHEDIFEFIKNNYDKNATDSVKRKIVYPLSKCDWGYTMNEHSDDNANWYEFAGFICFNCDGEKRMLFYHYENINHLDDLEYYYEHNLENLARSERTHIGLGYWGSSVEIIKEILENFGGGWIDENDCDDEEYYWVEAKRCETQTAPSEEWSTHIKLQCALHRFETNYKIRPNKIIMGCHVLDELCKQHDVLAICNSDRYGITNTYEGIPIYTDHTDPYNIEVGYMVKWAKSRV